VAVSLSDALILWGRSQVSEIGGSAGVGIGLVRSTSSLELPSYIMATRTMLPFHHGTKDPRMAASVDLSSSMVISISTMPYISLANVSRVTVA